MRKIKPAPLCKSKFPSIFSFDDKLVVDGVSYEDDGTRLIAGNLYDPYITDMVDVRKMSPMQAHGDTEKDALSHAVRGIFHESGSVAACFDQTAPYNVSGWQASHLGSYLFHPRQDQYYRNMARSFPTIVQYKGRKVAIGKASLFDVTNLDEVTTRATSWHFFEGNDPQASDRDLIFKDEDGLSFAAYYNPTSTTNNQINSQGYKGQGYDFFHTDSDFYERSRQSANQADRLRWFVLAVDETSGLSIVCQICQGTAYNDYRLSVVRNDWYKYERFFKVRIAIMDKEGNIVARSEEIKYDETVQRDDKYIPFIQGDTSDKDNLIGNNPNGCEARVFPFIRSVIVEGDNIDVYLPRTLCSPTNYVDVDELVITRVRYNKFTKIMTETDINVLDMGEPFVPQESFNPGADPYLVGNEMTLHSYAGCVFEQELSFFHTEANGKIYLNYIRCPTAWQFISKFCRYRSATIQYCFELVDGEFNLVSRSQMPGFFGTEGIGLMQFVSDDSNTSLHVMPNLGGIRTLTRNAVGDKLYHLTDSEIDVRPAYMHCNGDNTRLTIMDFDRNVYVLRPQNSDVIDLQLPESEMYYEGTQRTVFATLAVADYIGNLVERNVQLVLDGPAIFDGNGSRKITITTDVNANTAVGIKLIGYGTVFLTPEIVE
jgi:hypothetical protein